MNIVGSTCVPPTSPAVFFVERSSRSRVMSTNEHLPPLLADLRLAPRDHSLRGFFVRLLRVRYT